MMPLTIHSSVGFIVTLFLASGGADKLLNL